MSRPILARKNKKRLLSWALIVVICAACTPQTALILPTIAVLPTDTPSLTPSITLTPSKTPIPPTLTPIPPTLTPIPPTLTPSETFTPVDTPTITRTPSLTPQPTLPPTETRPPTATLTPSLTPIPPTATLGAAISFFTSDLVTLPAGGSTVLHWQTEADTVTLELLTASGTVISSYGVATTGDRAVQLAPDLGTSVIYRLIAKRGKTSATRTITLVIQCANTWFFNPAPAGCPPQAAYPVSGFKYQSFERGLAFYIPSTNNVYLLANAGNRVNAYPMDWNYAPLAVLTPPSGLLQPGAEIGYVWLTKPWSDGSHLDIALGWATSPLQAYGGQAQAGSSTDLYVKGPTGAIYKLALAGTGTWSIVGSAK